jgi:hypothetical protein
MEMTLEAKKADTSQGRSKANPGSKKPARVNRAGGPRSASGKLVSSKNATKHGILSKNPIVGPETIEDWDAHLEGLRAAWKPVGHYENVLVHRAATCLWRRARVDEWVQGLIRTQLEMVDLKDAFENDPEAQPLSGEILGIVNEKAALDALDQVRAAADDQPLASDGAHGIVEILMNGSMANRSTEWVGIPRHSDPLGFKTWTTGQMRQSLENIAAKKGSTIEEIIDSVKELLEVIAFEKSYHNEYQASLRRMKIYRAITPSGADADLELRYSAHFDREFARILKWFEEAQRARTNDLPAPIRIDLGYQ